MKKIRRRRRRGCKNDQNVAAGAGKLGTVARGIAKAALATSHKRRAALQCAQSIDQPLPQHKSMRLAHNLP
eukprot:gene14859-biopygen12672